MPLSVPLAAVPQRLAGQAHGHIAVIQLPIAGRLRVRMACVAAVASEVLDSTGTPWTCCWDAIRKLRGMPSPTLQLLDVFNIKP